MASSSKKLNFIISSEVAKELEKLIPLGKRSKVVNDAIMKELTAIRRRQLTDKLLVIKQKSPSLSTHEIVSALKTDRGRR